MAKQVARSRVEDDGPAANLRSGEAPGTTMVDVLKKKARRAAKGGETLASNPDIPRVPRRSTRVARGPATGKETGEQFGDDPMARQLREGFAEAVRRAVRQAHAAGLAVPARQDGVAVEIRPGGDVVPIDDNAPWSPADWRKSATR
jgi:hypothetical protein